MSSLHYKGTAVIMSGLRRAVCPLQREARLIITLHQAILLLLLKPVRPVDVEISHTRYRWGTSFPVPTDPGSRTKQIHHASMGAT
jgi:hypothetical protein